MRGWALRRGDGIEVGSRLATDGLFIQLVLVDKDLFRFSTPEDVEQAQDSIYDAKMCGCDLVIFNGLRAMVWLCCRMGAARRPDLASPLFNGKMINPLLSPLGAHSVIETDHP